MTDVSEFKIEKYDGTEYVYPAWAQWTGRILSACTIACIPIGAVIAVVRARVGRPTLILTLTLCLLKAKCLISAEN